MPKLARSKPDNASALPVPASSDATDVLPLLDGNSPVGAFRSDAEGKCVWVNEKWSEISGYSLEEALGDGWGRALHPDDKERVFREWSERTSEGCIFCEEYRFLRTDGTVRWLLGRATKQFDKNGNVTGYFGVILDITALRQRPSRTQEPLPEGVLKLSKREIEVARLLSDSHSNKQVAAKLKLSVRTVEAHRSRLMRKLRLKSVAGLVRYAIATGLVD